MCISHADLAVIERPDMVQTGCRAPSATSCLKGTFDTFSHFFLPAFVRLGATFQRKSRTLTSIPNTGLTTPAIEIRW